SRSRAWLALHPEAASVPGVCGDIDVSLGGGKEALGDEGLPVFMELPEALQKCQPLGRFSLQGGNGCSLCGAELLAESFDGGVQDGMRTQLHERDRTALEQAAHDLREPDGLAQIPRPVVRVERVASEEGAGDGRVDRNGGGV